MKSGFKNADSEITDYAEPFLKTIQKQIPKTKINIINPTILDYKNYYNKKFLVNQILPPCQAPTPVTLMSLFTR